MKITNVEWNEGAPERLMSGMLIEDEDDGFLLIGDILTDGAPFSASRQTPVIKRWAWLIQPHELNWLEDMANKHKARARG
ncbi:hypothetical protein ACM7M3_28955 [Pseudomonas aeruginosa]